MALKAETDIPATIRRGLWAILHGRVSMVLKQHEENHCCKCLAKLPALCWSAETLFSARGKCAWYVVLLFNGEHTC